MREAIDQHTGRFHESLRLNTLFALTLTLLNAMLVTSDRRLRHRAVALRLCRRRHRGHGAADDDADHQRVRLGGLADHRHLREYRRGAGRHAHDRAATRSSIGRMRVPLAVTRGEIRFEDIRLRLWQRDPA